MSTERVAIDYTNWRGERRTRVIYPLNIRFGTSPWHTTPQWLLNAVDLEDRKGKDFALKDIHSWTPVEQ